MSRCNPVEPVVIVGAGPGDPELLTLKALRVLQEADVVVYDRLIGTELLAMIPPGVSRVYAGKSCKDKAMSQEEINHLLASLARSGRRVVRLKGGDPFIFGRGGEEAEYLVVRGIPFEIIPGISSASGCSAYAGIPLTHRGLATGVRYFTGHSAGENEPNWQSLADPATTLVIYMGLANLQEISRKLIVHGLPPHTPAAAIQDGTLPSQRVCISTLARIWQDVQSGNFEPPTVIIIGRVVALAESLGYIKEVIPCAPAANA